MIENDVFRGFGVEIILKKPDNFLVVKETLTRIGVSSKDKKLYQSCHILHKKRGDNSYYAIVHFKELFALDGRPTNIDKTDLARRNTIAELLEQWNLVDIADKSQIGIKVPISQIKIVPFKEKGEWDLVAKYQIGTK